MKRTGIDHPKFRKLAQFLNARLHVAIGVCEMLYHFTAKHAIQGDIGKWSDEDIAVAVDWPTDDAHNLVLALVEAKLLDKSDKFRLVVHDWHDHADDSTKKTIVNRSLKFVTGSGRKRHSGNIRTRSGKIQNDSVPPAIPGPASPEPEPEPQPKPEASRKSAGVFECVTEELLRDNAKLNAWFDDACRRRKPVIGSSDANRLRVFGAAERALEHGDSPPALFADIVSGGHFERITSAQEERARLRLLEKTSARDPPNAGIAGQLRRIAEQSSKGVPA